MAFLPTKRQVSFRSKFGANFFDVDIIDQFGNVIERVGTTEERVIRRQALTIRKIARRSMRKKRRYRSVASMPPEMQLMYRSARRQWHIMGSDPMYEPQPQNIPVPSKPGTPPGVVHGQLKRFLLAEKSSKSLFNKFKGTSFVVGPKLLPGKKTAGATTPEVHEHSGTKTNVYGSGAARKATYPKRPYMKPALAKTLPYLAQFWKNQVKP